MKYCSRYTIGIIIGALNVLAYSVATLFVIIQISFLSSELTPTISIHGNEISNKDITIIRSVSSAILFVCLIMVCISGLLIMGIIKKRHNMMLPWLVLNGIAFVANVSQFFVHLMFALVPIGYFLSVFFFGVLVIGIQSLILWPIYILYRDIRDNKNADQINTEAVVNFRGVKFDALSNTNQSI